MREARTEIGAGVRLLDVDPDLAAGLPRSAHADAAHASWVATWLRSTGRWSYFEETPPDVALYVISGTLVRRVTVERRTAVELLGPGQVLRPAVASGATVVQSTGSWRVLSPTWLAVLDRSFWQAMSDYPDVWLALLDRAVQRSETLTFRLAIVGVRNLRQRLLALLWHLAESWGRVGPGGVTLELTLSHEVLADLVSAHRSSVSKAVKDLERAGKLTQTTARTFVLHTDHDFAGQWSGLAPRLAALAPMAAWVPLG